MNSWRRVSAYESESDGIFRENDLENYVYESIAELPDLTHLSEVFYPFYVFTAVRKIFFGLDPNRMGKIRSTDLLTSKVFWEWLQLFPPWHPDVGGCGSKELYPQKVRLDDEIKRSFDACDRAGDALMDMLAASVIVDCDAEITRTNWFSAANAVRVYSLYLDLDVDQNGLLSPAELTRAQNSTLTEAFVGRVFQEVHTYTGEMDYKAFLDFTLAMEFRTSSSSMRYIFSALDLHRRGYLTLFELKYFFGEVVQRVVAAGHEPVDVANVCDEIFDMVNPEVLGRITLNDLKRCKVGHTVLHLLTDAAGFWQYDNREALLQQQQQARDGGEAPAIPTDLSHLDER
jgi:serine/threonine-protein phosphatase 2A regulatory subunit B''